MIRVAALLLVLTVLAVLHVAPLPEEGLFWRAVANAAHAPVFAIVAVVLFRIVSGARPKSSRIWQDYAYAAGASLIVAVTGEVLQKFGPRSSELLDLSRDLAGTAAGLIFCVAFDRRLLASTGYWGRRGCRWLAMGMAVMLLAVVQLPVLSTVRAYSARDESFPVLGAFDRQWELSFWRSRAIVLVDPPEGWGGAPRKRVARIALTAARRSGVVLREPVGDWSTYRELHLSAFVPPSRDVALNLTIFDVGADGSRGRRFDIYRTLGPGAHEIDIDLDELRQVLDLSRIHGLTILEHRPAGDGIIYLDDVRLVR